MYWLNQPSNYDLYTTEYNTTEYKLQYKLHKLKTSIKTVMCTIHYNYIL